MSDRLTLTGVLERQARSDAVMLIHAGAPLSFSEILEQSRRFATALRLLGIGEGDRVAIWMPTHPVWWVSLFACARLGAIAVAVNTRYVARELSDIVRRSGSRVLVYWPGFARVDFAAILDECDPGALPDLRGVVAYRETGDAARTVRPAWRSVFYDEAMRETSMGGSIGREDSPCLIWTTSGTTMAPKFVLHAQRSLIAHAADVIEAHGFDRQSVLMLAPPICGAFGCCLAIAMCVAGRPVITNPVWDPALAASWIHRYGATHMHGVDDAIAQVLGEAEPSGSTLASLRYCGFGAFNPARRDIVDVADAHGLKIVGLYGSSEIQALVSRQSEEAPSRVRAQAGGRLISPFAKARARNPQTAEVLPPGEIGELEIHAPTSRMLGYFGDPDATAAAFTRDGYYRTGDLGFIEDDGRIAFLGRLGDTMRLGGFLVSPREIEAVVEEIAGSTCQVVDVPLAGVPRAFAFVLKTGKGVDEDMILDHCSRNLARYKVPCRIVEVEAFPVADGTNGVKVRRGRLREMAAELLSGR